MRTGALISGTAHVALIVAAVVNIPWLRERSAPPLAVTEVTFITADEFEAAAQSAPAPIAPVPSPAPEPEAADAPPPAPAPAPQQSAPPPPAPRDPAPADVATVVTPPAGVPAAPEAPAADAPPPPPAPLVSSAPPAPRPAQRVEATPVPPPPEAAREDAQATPEVAEAPEPEVVAEARPATAPPEAAPEIAPEAPPAPMAEAAPPPPSIALERSERPLARRGNMSALPRQVAEAPAETPEPEPERPAEPPQATPPTPTPPTPPSPAPVQTAEPAPSSAPAAASPSQSPTGTAAVASGPPMTPGEKDGLKFAIQRCWNVPAGLRDAHELRITVAAELGADGEVIASSVRMIEPSAPPDGRYDAAYRAARSAIIRCGPYSDLPRDKYAQWRQIEVVFNPEGMVSW